MAKSFITGDFTTLLLNSIMDLDVIGSRIQNAIDAYDGYADLDKDAVSDAIFNAKEAVYMLVKAGIDGCLIQTSNFNKDKVTI